MAASETRPAFRELDGKTPQEVVQTLPTPCYIIEEKKLRENGKVLASVSRNTGCKILLAQKAFSNYDFYPELSEYLAGTEASGLYEARLGAEEMPEKENLIRFPLRPPRKSENHGSGSRRLFAYFLVGEKV